MHALLNPLFNYFILQYFANQKKKKRQGIISRQNLAGSLEEAEKPQQRRAQNPNNAAAAFGCTERREMVWPRFTWEESRRE